eukprot:192712_1
MHLKDYFEQQKEELDTHMKEQQRKFEQKFIEQKAKENELKMRENKLKEQERDMQSLLFKDIETTQQQTPSQQNKRRKVSFDTSGSTQPISKYSPFLTTQQLTQSIRRPSSNTLFKVSTATTKQTYQPKGLNTSLNTGYPVHPDSYLNDNDEDEDDDEDDDNDTNNYSQMRNINHRDINPNLNANQNNDSPNNNQDNNRQNGHQNNNKRGDDGTGDHGDHDGNGGDGRSGDNRRQSDGNDGFPPPNNAFETFIMSQTQAMKDLSEEIKKGRNGNGDNKWKSTHRIKCMESIKIRFNGNPNDDVLSKINDLLIQARTMPNCLDDEFLVQYMVQFGMGYKLKKQWKLTLNEPNEADRADHWDGMVKWLLTVIFDARTVLSKHQQNRAVSV